jgi:hypothetical protein
MTVNLRRVLKGIGGFAQRNIVRYNWTFLMDHLGRFCLKAWHIKHCYERLLRKSHIQKRISQPECS